MAKNQTLQTLDLLSKGDLVFVSPTSSYGKTITYGKYKYVGRTSKIVVFADKFHNTVKEHVDDVNIMPFPPELAEEDLLNLLTAHGYDHMADEAMEAIDDEGWARMHEEAAKANSYQDSKTRMLQELRVILEEKGIIPPETVEVPF